MLHTFSFYYMYKYNSYLSLTVNMKLSIKKKKKTVNMKYDSDFFFLKRDIALINIYVKIVDELLRLDKCDIKLVVELRFFFYF